MYLAGYIGNGKTNFYQEIAMQLTVWNAYYKQLVDSTAGNHTPSFMVLTTAL